MFLLITEIIYTNVTLTKSNLNKYKTKKIDGELNKFYKNK